MQRKQWLIIICIFLTTILIPTVIGILIGPASNALPQINNRYALLLLALLLLAGIAITIWQFRLQSESDSPTQTMSSQNRKRMLAKVRAFWITGVLEKSLYDAALITVGLNEQSDAVKNPWQPVLQQTDQTTNPLPSNTRITQVFDDGGGEMLLLGAPGSGKTTLLLELARDLLDRADKDDNLPVPVVFNLSSWAVKRQSITDWLIEELNTKYQVPWNTGQSWVMDDQVLPLLDGLDEVALQYREDCVKAINTYRNAHGLVPTVVCCRNADYQTLKTRLLLRRAVVVQPLTTQQIEDYLSSAVGHLEVLRMALHDDPVLQELAATPLMLSVLTLVYSGQAGERLVTASSPKTQRQQIFATYVERMLTRRGAEKRYTPQQTVQWLTWLAQQLKEHSQTEFYIERMQVDWLPENSLRRFYRTSTKLMGRLAIGLIAGLIAGMTFKLILLQYDFFAIILGLIAGLAFILFNIGDTEPIPAAGLIWSWVSRWQDFIKSLAIGLVAGLIAPLFSQLFNLLLNLLSGQVTLTSQTGYHFLIGIWSNHFLAAYLVAGLNAGLIVWLVGRLVSIGNTEIKPAEVITWSWVTMWKSLFKSLGTGLITGLTAGLSIALVAGLAFWFVYKLDSKLTIETAIANGMTFGLIAGLSMWLSVGLVGGFSSSMLDERNRIIPNQGIRRSARISVLAGLIGILVGGLIGGLIFGLVYELPFALLLPNRQWFFRRDIALDAGLVFGLVFGLAGLLPNGGAACIKHAILRLLLRHSRCIPRNYPRFLDYAAERILLRKVGGGYIFVHRLVLEYFASQNSTPSSDGVAKEVQMAPEDGRSRWQNVADTK